MIASQLHTLLCLAFVKKLKVLIVGKPGVGKTDIVSSAVRKVGYNFIIMHPAISDPTDFKGMPCIINGVAMFIAFNELKLLIEADTPLVCFIDDLGQAPHAVQAAIMQLILARRLNDHKISDHVIFVAATNDSSHRAGVHGLLEPVKSRFDTIIHFEPDFDSWRDWAYASGVDPLLVSFFRFRPKLLCDFQPTAELKNSPSPRSAAAVNKWLHTIENNDALLMEVITGAAGQGFAVEFMAFLKVFRELPAVEEIFKNPTKAKLPGDMASRCATVGSIVGAVSKLTIGAALTYLARMGKEFEVFAVSDIVKKDPNLAGTGEFSKWSRENTAYTSGLS